ncbi:DUF5681 domain-containing protein [Methylobacterium sp. E-065]|uniref:DUF5681 domain-containing protein n=1 Tax=Methylobacterium sp. E-065 TaxID=2836583 RepID=UPI001FB88FE7|nr:DUF5681 domain-containing protein [Methylobacterium sp. E-065]MCJ2021193.1 DUF5681 domain-containing protein [Methylobacterium sp. E-065]
MVGRPFVKGQSGNPSGKPRGCRHRVSKAVESLLDGEAKALTRKAISMAKSGDGPALRLCLDRISPPRRDRTIIFALPPIASSADLPLVTAALLAGVSAGEITPGEAAELGKLLDAHCRAVEASDFAARLSALEKAAGQSTGRPL